MEKYRIVEVKIPVLKNKIEYKYEYHIERYIDNGLWGWGNAWVPGYHPNIFTGMKQAELQIEFMNKSKSSKVVKEY